MDDSGARQPFLDAMAAAGRHDPIAIRAALDQAEAAVGDRPHKAHADIAAAREATSRSDWVAVWMKAHHGLCDLTWSFPPDLGTCPPMPGEQPLATEGSVCSKGHPSPVAARFCAWCGESLG